MSRIAKCQVDVKWPAGGADSDWSSSRRSSRNKDRRGSSTSIKSSAASAMLTSNSNRMIVDKSSLYLSLKPSNAFEEINLNANAGADSTPVNEVAITTGSGGER